MKRPTESEIYEQAFEFVSKCRSFRRTGVYDHRVHHFSVNDRDDPPGEFPALPHRLEPRRAESSVWLGYELWGEFAVDERRTFWEWLTRKPSEKAQWIQALDAAAALLR